MGYKRSMFNIYFNENGVYYLYNSLTGAFVTLEPEYVKFYENEKLWAQDKEKLKEFKEGGFIVDENLDEYRYYYFKVIDALWRNSRHSFTIVTTTTCNFACPYCYEAQYGMQGRPMHREVMEKTVEFIEKRLKNIRKNSVNLVFYGGEPLLNKEAIFFIGGRVKEITKELDMHFNSEIITNGYLFTKDVAGKMKEEVNLVNAQITIDGPERIHDKTRPLKGNGKTFKKIVENIIDVLNNVEGIHISCRSNLSKSNYMYYGELLEFVHKNIQTKVKYPSITCSPYFAMAEKDASNPIDNKDIFTPEEYAKVYVKEILPLLLKYKHINIEHIIPEPRFYLCMAPSPDGVLIDPDGTLKKCWDLVGLKEHSIGDIFDGIRPEKKLQWLGYEFFGEECKSCPFLPVCGGACAKKVIVDGERPCDFRKYVINDLLKFAYTHMSIDNERNS